MTLKSKCWHAHTVPPDDYILTVSLEKILKQEVVCRVSVASLQKHTADLGLCDGSGLVLPYSGSAVERHSLRWLMVANVQ